MIPIHVNALYITFAIGTAIPFLIALVTKSTAADGLKALLTIGLAALSAVLVQINSNGNSFVWGPTIILFATTFLTSLGTYLGFWKPALKINDTLLPDKGIG